MTEDTKSPTAKWLRECDKPLFRGNIPFSETRRRISDAADLLDKQAARIATLEGLLKESREYIVLLEGKQHKD